MSFRNIILSIYLMSNILLVQNLYAGDTINKIDIKLQSRSCEGLSQDECMELDNCDWIIIATPDGIFEICMEAGNDDGGNGDGGSDECSQLSQDECETVEGCHWNVWGCQNYGDWECVMDCEGFEDFLSDNEYLCEWLLQIFPTGCAHDCSQDILDDIEEWMIECSNDGGNGSEDCSDIDNAEECNELGCEWTIVATPNGVFEMCIEPDSADDGDWNDDGGWNFSCEGLAQDECALIDWCDWNDEDGCYRPNDWNDDGGWENPCSELSQDECIDSEICDWTIIVTPNGIVEVCAEIAGPNPCSDFGQEECEFFDECVWTDQGCQDYNWNDCDPNLICGQALTCVDNLLYPTTCGPENCDTPIGECDQGDDGGNTECEGLSYEDCEGLDYCEWISDSNNPNSWGSCVESNDEGPPECLLDCEGIENINPDEDPYEACDLIITLFGFDPGFSSCTSDCDDETMIFINEVVEACYECLSDTTLDCADVFNDNEECSDLSYDDCVDAEDCEPNFDAAGQFEGCIENNSQEEGCYEDGEFYCLGCELFISECEYLECTENGWAGPFTLDNPMCNDDHQAILKLEDVVGMPGSDVIVPMYLTSTDSVGGVQFKLLENYDVVPSGISSLDDCFTANYNNLDEAFIGIIFSLEGCNYPANETVHIANLVFYVSDYVPVGIEINLEFDYTIVADSGGIEVPSSGIGSSILLGMQGDVNADGEINVLDIVAMVNFALGSDFPSDNEFWASDINNDGSINVLDVVSIVSMILGN